MDALCTGFGGLGWFNPPPTSSDGSLLTLIATRTMTRLVTKVEGPFWHNTQADALVVVFPLHAPGTPGLRGGVRILGT